MNKKILLYGFIILVLLAGLYLRVGGILTGSFAFTYDVGRDLLEVKKIVHEFDIPLIGQTTGLGGFHYGPWWYYFLTPSFFISGGNPSGIVFFMILTGLVTAGLGYYFGKKLAGVFLSLTILSFISFSDAMVALSSQIWNPNLAPLFVILLYIFLFLPFKNKRAKVIASFLIGLTLGFILDSEIVFGVLLIVSAGLIYLYLHGKKAFNKNLIYIFIGFLFTLLPRVLFEFRHNFIMTRSLFSDHSGDQQIFDPASFFTVFPNRVQVILSQIGDTFGLSVLGAIILCIGILVTWILFRDKKIKKVTQVFVSSFIILVVFLVGSALFARAIWGHYLVGLPLIYIIVVSLSLFLIYKKYKVAGIILAVLLIILSSKPLQLYNNFQNPNWEGNAAVYRNQVAVIDYIYKDADGKKFNYIAYTPVVHDYTYQYLFSYHGEKNYSYIPSTETQELFYVIVEPDPGFEGRITDWLKIREGDGEIVNEKEVKGGIKVQKRLR